MNMDREQFESALDRLVGAHRRKVCAATDAGACQTPYDWKKSREADDAYEEARDRFLAEVFAPPPPVPPPVPPAPVVVGREARDRGRTRGRPVTWRRWVEVRIPWKGLLYTFTAKAGALALGTGAVRSGDDAELRSPDFDPLDLEHAIRFRGLDYATSDAAPAEVQRLAVEASREVAGRLLARGVDYDAVTRVWPEGWPPFAAIVAGTMADEPTR